MDSYQEWAQPDYTFDTGANFSFGDIGSGQGSSIFEMNDGAWDDQFDMVLDDFNFSPHVADNQESEPWYNGLVDKKAATSIGLAAVSGLAKSAMADSARSSREEESQRDRDFRLGQEAADREHALELEKMREESAWNIAELNKRAPGRAEPTTTSLFKQIPRG